MNPAEAAMDNAVPLEVKKDGLQQRQNGDWVLRLVIAAPDMDPRITNAAMGARFMAALVEIGDDEQPKKQKHDWRELTPTTQSILRCKDERFWRFLLSEHGHKVHSEEGAANALYAMFNITSRSEISSKQKVRMAWHTLDSQYQEWRG